MPIAVKIVACRSLTRDFRIYRSPRTAARRRFPRTGGRVSSRRRTAARELAPVKWRCRPYWIISCILSALARDWSLAVLPGTPSIIMSRLNSLARTTSVRSSRPRASRSRISCAIGRSISFFICARRGVAVFVRVPVQERDVFGRHLDEPGAGFDQPPRQQTAQPESAGVVLVVALLRLQRQVERLAVRRGEQAIGVVHRAEHRLLLIVAAVIGRPDFGATSSLVSLDSAAANRPGSCPSAAGRRRRPDRDTAARNGPIFAAEKAGRVKRLQFLLLADVFEPLADVDERRESPGSSARAPWRSTRRDAARRPSAAARSRCASDTDAASAGCSPRSGRTCERISVPRSMTLAMFSSPSADLDVVDGRVDRRERAHDPFDRQRRFRTA